MDKYSVLMSLYKKENPVFFRSALKSILDQTISPDEIVLVEDGPLTDELYEIISEFSENLKIVKNKKNMGLGLALNVGLKECSNEIVARMDTDDIASIDRCEKQLTFLEKNPAVTIVGGQIEEFIENPDEVVGKRLVPLSDLDLKTFMRKRCPFNHMTVMFKKSDIIAAGNYQDWFWNEDYYLWIRLAQKGYIFSNLPDTLVYTRVGDDMYQRRGGSKYFKSEIGIQKYMFENKIINCPTYLVNCGKRLIVEILMPNKLRGWVFQKFARD